MTPNLFNGRTMMQWIIAMIGVGMFVACDDDDESDADTPLVNFIEVEQSDEFAFRLVCSGLFNAYDSLYTVPALGEVLDVTQPSVYTTGVADEASARAFFDNLCVDEDRCTTLADGSIQYSLGTYGNLCYHPFGEDGALASLEVNLHEVSSLTRLNFIAQDLWPNNAASPIELGDIVTDSEYGYTWVCVQEYGAGLPALFLTFDGAQVSTVYQSMQYRQCASYEALYDWYVLVQSGLSRFTPNTKEYKSLQQKDSLITKAINFDNSFTQLYCTGMRANQYAYKWCEKPKINSKKVYSLDNYEYYRDYVDAQYHLISFNKSAAYPIAKDLTFVCHEEKIDYVRFYSYQAWVDMKGYYYGLRAEYEQWIATQKALGGIVSGNCWLWQYHSGTVEYGGNQWTIKEVYINQNTLSVSVQDVATITQKFTKVEL